MDSARYAALSGSSVSHANTYVPKQYESSPLRYPSSEEAFVAAPAPPNRRRLRRRMVWLGVVLGLVVAGLVGFIIWFFVHQQNASSSSASAAVPGVTTNGPISGGDGSLITLEDGTTVTYNNSFGGYWYFDPSNPYGAGGKANSWTPASNETWEFGVDSIYGVNLGGWLVLEPFIAPALYQKYTPTPVDEWTLSEAMANDTAGGGLQQIADHYDTFITEVDFAQIAAAGLNWVRIPFPFWAISKIEEEPFLEGAAWPYFLKAIAWARKYGLRVNLDLHTIPGSQNGWNHSGRLGQVNFLNGAMGLANAQRTLDYIKLLTEFISQPTYAPVVQMFGIINEPFLAPTGPLLIPDIKRFYYNSYEAIRSISGLGNGNGPMISLFHGFALDTSFYGWLPGADRIMLDDHPYTIFTATQSDAPPASHAQTPCTTWANYYNATKQGFGLIGAGEFSSAINDCGLWVHQVGQNSSYAAQFGSCDMWLDYEGWDADTKSGLQTFVKAQMDALQNWFFWTWKIAPDDTGAVQAPFWSYSLGVTNGWLPTDPRTAAGTCLALGYPASDPVDLAAVFAPYETPGSLAPSTTEDYGWPPPTIAPALALAQMPTYTETGPVPTPTVSGWTELGKEQSVWAVPVLGCAYPDAWLAASVVPTPCATAV